MKTLIVLCNDVYKSSLSVSTDCTDDRDTKFVNQNNHLLISHMRFDTIVYIGKVLDDERKKFRTLLKT